MACALHAIGVSSTAFQAGENDQPNVALQRSFQAFLIYPFLRRSRRRRIAPSDPSLNQPSRQCLAACPERPYPSRTFTNLNDSLNHEPRQTISFIEISIEAGRLLGGKHEACFVLGLAGIEPMPSWLNWPGHRFRIEPTMNPKNGRTKESISHRPLESSMKT